MAARAAARDRRRNLFCRGYCACQGGARAETCRRASRCDACDPTMLAVGAMASLGPIMPPPPQAARSELYRRLAVPA